MKKIFILEISILIFVLFSVLETKSQLFECPDNCAEYEFTYRPDIPGCNHHLGPDDIVYVKYCCCFDASGPGYTATVTEYNWPNCSFRNCVFSDTIRRNLFLKQLIDSLRKDVFTREPGCLSDIPPCDDPGMVPVRVSIRLAKCWKEVNFWSYRWNEWILASVRCPNTTAECDKWYQVCRDFQTMRLRILAEGCNMIGNDNCSFEIPIIPPPGKTETEPWETECYALPCCP
ncbi:MAG: hypothetical protein ACK42Z_03950 [Candidatus Kapaibacteriota bacterium]